MRARDAEPGADIVVGEALGDIAGGRHLNEFDQDQYAGIAMHEPHHGRITGDDRGGLGKKSAPDHPLSALEGGIPRERLGIAVTSPAAVTKTKASNIFGAFVRPWTH